MNRKGFTLVEAIVVIAIIAILLLVLVPNVFVMINKNKEKSCNNIVKNIESAAKIYVAENKYDMEFECSSPNNTKSITLNQLIAYGKIKVDSNGKIINPINDKEISLESIIKITYNCNTKDFNYTIEGIDCTNN